MQIIMRPRITSGFWIRLLILTVGAHGLYILITTLADQLTLHGMRTELDINLPLLIGLGLIYLSTLLRRRKQMAWLVAVLAYVFMLGMNLHRIEYAIDSRHWVELLSIGVLPVILICLLLISRRQFTVRSDTRSFLSALRTSVLILIVTLIYGVAGFVLLDRRDFQQDISVTAAIDRTFDQFGLIDSQNLQPYTRRAHLFVDSLSFISISALAYVAVSLFQPIKARVTAGRHQHEQMQELLDTYGGGSEDFFKVWPLDKSYYFDDTGRAGLAYKTQGKFALQVGDPVGEPERYETLLRGFEDTCFGNGWTPVIVHSTSHYIDVYDRCGYAVQKIGEEAIIDVKLFQMKTRRDKYFRQIMNKYDRENYEFKICQPPHSKALLSRLQTISDEWLERPGRSERGFMMGYYSPEYMNSSSVMIAKDPAGTIQGFLNQIPSPDPDEANFDLLRHANTAPTNINDYLLLGFIAHLEETNVARLNLGLSPLAGMDDLEDTSLLSRALHLVYTKGDRFYSFSGLQRFKNKYKPEWYVRYIAYKGTPPAFLAAMTAVTRALRLPRR